MAEIKLTRTKSIYGDIRGLLSQIPQTEVDNRVRGFTVKKFNDALDNLTDSSGTDYSDYKIPPSEIMRKQFSDEPDFYDSTVVRAQIGRVIGRLEQEYGFSKEELKQSPSIVILNENQNAVSLQINYTLNDLIDKTDDEKGKTQLRELKDELEKPNKNWEKIKSILIWVLNFSKELFLEILPIILQKNP